MGRLFSSSDHNAQSAPVVVLSHGTWLRHFGGDPGAVGREFRTERVTYTVVGVAPRGFDGTVEDDVVEFFMPIEQYEPQALRTNWTSRSAWVIGRRAPGRSSAVAQAEAEAIHRGLVERYPDIYRRWRVRVEPLGESWRERLRSGGSVLFGASMLLLMIAAVNVGCLLLTRVLDRRRELAIRAALDADARRIVAQLFVEALLLVSAGGVVGMLAGPWLFDAFLALAPLDGLTLPRYLRLEPDTVTLALAVAALTVAGLLAGTVPAFLGTPTAPADVLRAGGRGILARTTERRWTSALIVVETALTLVLLVAGSLLVRSYARLSSADLGFERDRIARLAVTLSPADFGSREQLPSIYERLARVLKTVAGVERIGFVSPTLPPWDGYRSRLRPIGVELPQTPDGLEVGTSCGTDRTAPPPHFVHRPVVCRPLDKYDG